MKNFFLNWVLPPKARLTIRIIVAKLKNRFSYDQSFFKKNDLLKDIEKGKRCFIIAPGPSIEQQDLSLLKDETCIAISKVYAHKDFTAINPKYYVLSPVFKYHKATSSEDALIAWLRPIDESLSDDTIIFAYIGDKPYFEKYSMFNNNKVHWLQYIPWDEGEIGEIDLENLPDIKSVSETTFSIALYLGFDEIYIMGFDHNWFEGFSSYFKEGSSQMSLELVEEKAKKFGFDSEFQMIRHAKMFNKYKKLYALKKNIYNANANQNSYVDTFPKVKYEDLFKA